MALHNEGVIEHSGQDKELDAGAIDMLMDNLQISQYVFPVKSTIRELGSNARDAITEKLNAIAILTGKAKVEDFYYVPGKDKKLDAAIKANPGVYKNSTFDPNYYMLGALSDNNRVEITYKQNDTKAKDTLTVKDWGVGIADYRLGGYLKLGWSSKRLSIKPLGKFGLGAKVPLSIAPYYQLNTVHNGRKFSIMVYSRHWDSIVPEKNLLTGRDNDFILFYNDDGTPILDSNGIPRKVYFEEQSSSNKNYSETIVECKKHHLVEVTNAVQSQLLYFDNVDFTIISPDGLKQQVEVMSPKLYEDEGLVVSDNKFFSKPHIVINDVNYGYINTDELEIEDLKGNIGVKMVADEIDVTPNRENVIWNDKAVKVVLKRIKESSKAAKALIMDSFRQTDFMEWLGACAGVFGYGDKMAETTTNVKALIQLQYIAKVRHNYSPTFAPDPTIRYIGYIPSMFPGLKIRKVTKKTVHKRNGLDQHKVDREEETSVQALFNYPVFTYETVPTEHKDLYLLEKYPNGFILIRKGDNYFHENVREAKEPTDNNTKTFLEELKAKHKDNDPKVVNPLLLAGLDRYEDVILPKEFVDKQVRTGPTAESIRKAEQRIVVQTPDTRGMMQKVEPKIGDLNTIDKEFYWGLNDDRDGLLLAAAISGKGVLQRKFDTPEEADIYTTDLKKRKILLGVDMHTNMYYTDNMTNWYYPNTPVMLGLVSKENARYLAEDHYHISEFYNRYQDGVLTMAQSLINWNTGRIMSARISNRLAFMAGMQQFNPERFEEWRHITHYISSNYRNVNASSLQTAIIEHVDKVAKLQEVIADDPKDTETIAVISRALFGSEIQGAKAVELDWIRRLDELLSWAEPIKDLLNAVNAMTSNYQLDTKRFDAIREYIAWKTGE